MEKHSGDYSHMAKALSPHERFAKWVDSVGCQEAAGELIGISQSYVAKIIAGNAGKISADILFAIERETKRLRGGPIRASSWGLAPRAPLPPSGRKRRKRRVNDAAVTP